MDFLTTYCSAGVGHAIYDFLTIEDDLRLDSVCKTIREFHRKDVYPVALAHVCVDDITNLMDDVDNNKARCKFMNKISEYIREISSEFNDECASLPNLTRLTNVRKITFAIPIIIDVKRHDIHISTHRAWKSIETILHQKNDMEEHPLKSVRVIPGNIYLADVDAAGRILTSHCIADNNESTHQEYYRWFYFHAIHVPTSLCIDMYLPTFTIFPNSRDEYGLELKCWSWNGPKNSIGMMMLEMMN
jgi:hypothetical protein